MISSRLGPYPNAFSLLPFSIKGTERDSVLDSLSLTPEEVCDLFGEGIKKLSRGQKFKYLVPDFLWTAIGYELKVPPLAHHLTIVPEDLSIAPKEQFITEIFNTTLRIIDVPSDDFSREVPITSYGLDSLSAMRLVDALKPYSNITLMQLLGGMTWNQIEGRLIQPAKGDTPVIPRSVRNSTTGQPRKRTAPPRSQT